MQLVEDRPNVELRRGEDGGMIVVLAFPYDPHIVAVVRGIPQRRFDWDHREWWAPVDDWAGVHVAEVLERFPELTTSPQVDAWLAAIERRWVGRVSTTVHDGRALPVDPWIVEQLDAFMAAHGVAVDGAAAEGLRELRAEHDEALEAIRASRTTTGEPIASTAAVLGGELAPFQWGAVRYALRARRVAFPPRRGGGGESPWGLSPRSRPTTPPRRSSSAPPR